ncbi:hypothetical protein ACFCWY_08780 [Streptomyces sp. NPDC056362]|uniref:hypothetical protein n=1 Tax=unclassified Streptomyces TaxID=2593676 RepID=UPI0035D8EEC9
MRTNALREFIDSFIERVGALDSHDEDRLRELIAQQCHGHLPDSWGVRAADAVVERAQTEEWAVRVAKAVTASLIGPLLDAYEHGGPTALAQAARQTGRDPDRLVNMVLGAMAQTALPTDAQL